MTPRPLKCNCSEIQLYCAKKVSLKHSTLNCTKFTQMGLIYTAPNIGEAAALPAVRA